MKGKIAVIVTNEVQNELFSILESKGEDCFKISFSDYVSEEKRLHGFDTVILPFPSMMKKMTFMSKENADSFFGEKQLVIGGCFDDELKNLFKQKEIEYVDYFGNEAYVLANAYLTSQGLMRLLLNNAQTPLAGKNVLVTGFGRIGKSLSLMLKGHGMKVYTAVRNPVTAVDAVNLGIDTLSLSAAANSLFYFDYIFNTVPARLFTEAQICRLRDNTLYFEGASLPFGADEEHFLKHKKKHINASALPGRFYPHAVAENIYRFLKEEVT